MSILVRRVVLVVGALLVIGAIALLALSFRGHRMLDDTRTVNVEDVMIPSDPASLARGEHLVDVACRECHGEDLTGQAVVDDPAFATIYAANLTGLAQTRSDTDLVRAIRHGIAPDGRHLAIMPAEAFIHFSAEDLGSVIAYLKTVPPQGISRPKPRLGPLGSVLLGAGIIENFFPADYIDHNLPYAPMPEVGANVEYGAYVATFCKSCHGDDLGGGQPPDAESPPAPNLTPAGELGGWSETDFLTTIRTGVTPDNVALNPDFMPWQSFARFDDAELQGLWLYLQSLPPAPAE
jgi:mono/diheme cytochrome c family protein